VNFLGVFTRASYWHPYIAESNAYPQDRFVKTEYPPFDEEYFEWVDLLEAVVSAKGHFTMLELGAGWGRWTVNAAVSLKHLCGLPHTLIAVEAEPTHFQWMTEHVADNSVDPQGLQLINAAVAREDGRVGFYAGETNQGGPSTWYGQSIGGPQIVDCVSLNTLIRGLQTVDLIDIDVQGAELEVLEPVSQALDEKVKRIHIGTHGSGIEEGLRSLFSRLGWECVNYFPSFSSPQTRWGKIPLHDGVQTWLNPTYSSQREDELSILRKKLQASRQEGARLWPARQKAEEYPYYTSQKQ